jgi:hypothetical protein
LSAAGYGAEFEEEKETKDEKQATEWLPCRGTARYDLVRAFDESLRIDTGREGRQGNGTVVPDQRRRRTARLWAIQLFVIWLPADRSDERKVPQFHIGIHEHSRN